MSKHTQGPWAVSGVRAKIDGQSAHSVIWYDEDTKRDENICAVWYDPKTHVGFADARLISAAPDLLEALKRLSVLSDQIYVKMSDGENALMREAWVLADAAIAKATGGAK